MDYDTLQQIALNVVNTSAACDGQLFTGTVSNDNPLKIKLGEDSGSIELDGDDIILTQAVVTKKLYIKKHFHTEDKQLMDVQGQTASGPVIFVPAGTEFPPVMIDDPNYPPDSGHLIPNPVYSEPSTLTLRHQHAINTSTLDAWVTEYGHKLPVNPDEYNQDGDQVVITINRGLEKGDKVIMTQCSHGQQFIVLSRYFEVDKQGEDDE